MGSLAWDRVHVPGASGWQQENWQVLKVHRNMGHPDSGRWVVRELMSDGEWFAHDCSFDTRREALEYMTNASLNRGILVERS